MDETRRRTAEGLSAGLLLLGEVIEGGDRHPERAHPQHPLHAGAEERAAAVASVAAVPASCGAAEQGVADQRAEDAFRVHFRISLVKTTLDRG